MIDNWPSYSVRTTVDDLLTILEKYQNNTDRLSRDIIHWSAKLLEEADGYTDRETITRIAQNRLNTLMKDILVNPIDKAPLREPVLERSWVWEKSIHQEYRILFPVSPLDKGEMMENPPPHLFAIEMIAWAKKIVPQRQLTVLYTNQGQMAELAKHPQLNSQKKWLYQRLAQAAVWKEQTRQVREEMEWGLVEVNTTVKKIQEMSKLAIEKAERNALQTQQEIQEQIDTIERVHKETLTDLQNQMSWQEKTHKEKVASLEERMALKHKADINVVANLGSQVQALKLDHQNSISVLENKMSTQNKAHAANMASLEGQLSKIKQDHNSALSSIARLENDNAQVNRNLYSAKEDLKMARLNSQNQQAEIDRLNGSYQRSQSEVLRLRSEVADMDDDSCVIL